MIILHCKSKKCVMLKNLHLYLYKKYSNLFCCLSLCSYSTIFSEKQKKNVMEKKNNEVLEATVEVLKVELLNIFPSKQIKLGKILLEIQNNIQSNMEKKKSEIFVKIKYKDIFETNISIPNQYFNWETLYKILSQFFLIINNYKSVLNKSVFDLLKANNSSFQITIYKKNIEVLTKTYLVNSTKVAIDQGIRSFDIFYTVDGDQAYSINNTNQEQIWQKIAKQLLKELNHNLQKLKEE